MTIRKGLRGGSYTPLSDKDIRKIHETVLKTFDEVGIEVRHEEVRDLFRGAGASVDNETSIVKIPPRVVEKLIGQAPATVTLCGRDEDGTHDCIIGENRVYMGTGGTALNVQDPGSNDARRSTLYDIKDMARLVDKLDNIHFYMLNVYPNELAGEDVDINRFGTALQYTQKHIMGGVYTVKGVNDVIAMAEIIAGGRDKLLDRPFISMVTCVVSPLRLDSHYSQLTMEVAKHRIPVVVPSEPLSAATSPVTLAGTLVIQTVDTLAGVMLAQLVTPGTPVIYGSVASVADLATLKYLSGAIEMGLLNAGGSQMAQFYHLPFYATAGMSDSKVNDSQAGYETALSNLLVALAGGNFIHDAAGFLEFCMTASYDKLVIDNDIIGMTMRAVEGITVSDETLAFDLIKKVAPGGSFISESHTRRHMRREQYISSLADREDRETWQRDGARDSRQRATEKAQSVLSETPRMMIPGDVTARLNSTFPNLILP